MTFTKRVVVCTENSLTPAGHHYIQAGAMRCDKEPVVVCWGYNWDNPIGQAVGFQRDEQTNEISFDVTFFDDRDAFLFDEKLKESVEFSLYSTNVDYDGEEAGVRSVSSANIRAVTVFASGANPGARIQRKENDGGRPPSAPEGSSREAQ